MDGRRVGLIRFRAPSGCVTKERRGTSVLPWVETRVRESRLELGSVEPWSVGVAFVPEVLAVNPRPAPIPPEAGDGAVPEVFELVCLVARDPAELGVLAQVLAGSLIDVTDFLDLDESVLAEHGLENSQNSSSLRI